MESSLATLQHQISVANDRTADQREELKGVRSYADRLAQELVNLKQFKALERASMPEPDSEDETDRAWVPSPRKGRR